MLQLAQLSQIDAIVAYASDPATPTAAFVSEHMNLPGNPYASVNILTQKDLFRHFLEKNGFNVPKFKAFRRPDKAWNWVKRLSKPVFIKPVDSSGSKGVTRFTTTGKNVTQFDRAFTHAISFSREKLVLIEEEIIRSSPQIAGDGFLIDGELVFRCWADEHFDKLCNGLVPIGQTFPTSHSESQLALAHKETQRLITALGMKTGALNFDLIFDATGALYFLEIGPRNGGCLIPDVILHATGVDLIKYTVDNALGLSCRELSMQPTNGFWSSYMIHSIKNGTYKGLYLSDRIKPKIVQQDIWVKENDTVNSYMGSNDTIGTVILRFDTPDEMEELIENMVHHIRVILN